MYLIATSSKGISSWKLASLLGLQYRTTWHLAHRIRAMMDSDPTVLKGIVERDETDMGGRPRAANKPEAPAPIPLFEEPKPEPEPKPKKRRKAGRGTDKPMAFTAVACGGEVRLTPVLSQGTDHLIVPVRPFVDPSAILATDERPADIAIGRQHADHIRVNHSAGAFVRTDLRTGLKAHVNTAESVPALFQRAYIGVFPWLSAKHMGRYLREVEFHWNHRGPFEGRLTRLFATKAGPLPLQALFA